jgi:hypothetical protein
MDKEKEAKVLLVLRAEEVDEPYVEKKINVSE